MDVYITQTVLGIVGNCVGVVLFLAPIPTFIGMWKSKTIEGSPTPYQVALMSNLVWFLYGLPAFHPFSTILIYLNGIGITIQTIFLLIFIIITNRSKQRVMIIGVYVVQILVVGWICCVANITNYAHSFFIFLKEVKKPEGVENISCCLILATWVNAAIWTVYSLFPLDPFMLISKAMSIGFIQITMYVVCKRSRARITTTGTA